MAKRGLKPSYYAYFDTVEKIMYLENDLEIFENFDFFENSGYVTWNPSSRPQTWGAKANMEKLFFS